MPGPVLRESEASVGQRLLWLLDHYRGDGGQTNAPMAWRIRGALDEPALAAALDGLVERHETLRTTYAARGRRLVQLVRAPRPLTVERLEAPAGADAEQATLRAVRARARAPIDANVQPVTATLWRIAAHDHVLLLGIDHLATDFFSNMLVSRDLGWLYDCATGASSEPPPGVGWQYVDWVEDQRRAFADGRLETLRTFWKARLAGAEVPALPRCTRRETGETGEAGHDGRAVQATLDVPADVVEGLRAIGMAARATMFPVMFAAFVAHLHGLTGQRDVAVASLFGNRLRPEVQHTVGFFVNMIVLRTQVDPGAPFPDLVRSARGTVLQALAHADLPYQMLPAQTIASTVEGRPARVDDVVFQYLESPATRHACLDYETLDLTVQAGRFALELIVHNQSQCLLRCDATRFDAEWARAFLDGFGDLLARVAADPLAPVGAAPNGA